MDMVHQYKNNGYNIVLDVNSGSIHVVDDVVYDTLALMDADDENRYEEEKLQNISAEIMKKYENENISEEDMREIFDEFKVMEENGTLFSKDVYKSGNIGFTGYERQEIDLSFIDKL